MDGEAGWWTTSGNIGLPLLARVMGVGRQQQGSCINGVLLQSMPVYLCIPIKESNCLKYHIISFLMVIDKFTIENDDCKGAHIVCVECVKSLLITIMRLCVVL